MIIKILGVLDILIAVNFWIFGIFQIKSLSGFVLILAFFLLIKGIFFVISLNFISIIDIICAVAIIASTIFPLHFFIVIMISFFLIQKGIFSLI